MSNYQKKTSKTAVETHHSHLTLSDRLTIQARLNQGFSLSQIALELDKSISTISREIKARTRFYFNKRNDCIHSKLCDKKSLCTNKDCTFDCDKCNTCYKHCTEYEARVCLKRQKLPLGICNTCTNFNYCHDKKKYRYEGRYAHDLYTKTLIDKRSGFNLTEEEIKAIDILVTPLIKKGLSPYAIKEELGNKLTISEATLRRLINACKLNARNLDLRDAVKRKPRKKHSGRQMKNEVVTPKKAGHLYEDYLELMETYDGFVVQMDCVEGIKEDEKVLLTLHFPALHFQLAFIMDYHTSACVVDTLDLLEHSLGKELYDKYFSVILTDNGHEFTDIDGMEKSVFGGIRSRIFFCEPNRSDQKAECETNHKLIRYIISKGTSLQNLVQPDICKVMSHINSYPRKELGGMKPYTLASSVMPEEFFDIVGIDYIEGKDLVMKPTLLK